MASFTFKESDVLQLTRLVERTHLSARDAKTAAENAVRAAEEARREAEQATAFLHRLLLQEGK